MKRFSKFQLPAILWAIAIFVESSFSNLAPPPLGIDFSDKLAHAFVFGILGWLTTRAFINSDNKRLHARPIMFSILFCLLYGMSDEFHQYFVPGRVSDVYDFLADGLGVLVAQIPFFIILHRTSEKREVPNKQPNYEYDN
ncbi:VanZ family protein [candidate division KSB1 bacterium]|nr:VanZ family protein [candidate division KSB1 bacterium]